MEVKSGYKQTDVGVIPDDWHVRRLGELARIVRGGSPRPAGDPRYFNGTFIPWVTVASLTNISPNKMFVSETTDFLTEEGANYSRRLAEGTLLIANSGAKTLGVSKILSIECCANDGIAALLAQKGGNKLFLCYYLNSKINHLRAVVAAGNDQLNLNTHRIRLIAVPYPEPIEQEAIAEALGDADGLIESLEHLLVKKLQVKQGAMQELLTGNNRLPGFSGKWEEKQLGDLFYFSGGFSASRDQLSTKGHCYLHYGDIHGCKRTFIDVRSEHSEIPKLDISLKEVSATSLLEDGDVVFVDASEDDDGASRHVVVVNPDGTPFISGLHTIVAKSKTGRLDHLYRRYCFQTASVKKQFLFFAVGTKVSGISKTNIAKILLSIPDVPEQAAIAAILCDMDTEIVAVEDKLAKARQIKQGMVQELLTGRIRLV